MPGAVVKPGGGGTGSSSFGAIAGSPADNLALVQFVAQQVASVAPAPAPFPSVISGGGGTAGDSSVVVISGGGGN